MNSVDVKPIKTNPNWRQFSWYFTLEKCVFPIQTDGIVIVLHTCRVNFVHSVHRNHLTACHQPIGAKVYKNAFVTRSRVYVISGAVVVDNSILNITITALGIAWMRWDIALPFRRRIPHQWKLMDEWMCGFCMHATSCIIS